MITIRSLSDDFVKTHSCLQACHNSERYGCSLYIVLHYVFGGGG